MVGRLGPGADLRQGGRAQERPAGAHGVPAPRRPGVHAARTAELEPSCGARRPSSSRVRRRRLADLVAPRRPALAHELVIVARARRAQRSGERVQEWSERLHGGQNNADPAVQGAARGRRSTPTSGELGPRREPLGRQRRAARYTVLPDDVRHARCCSPATTTAGPLHRRAAVAAAAPALVGGIETTTSLIGNLVRRLLELGSGSRVAGAESRRWDTAIEESLRFDPPVLGLFRTANGDQRWTGSMIPDGSRWTACTRRRTATPTCGDDPEAFRLDRSVERGPPEPVVRRRDLVLPGGRAGPAGGPDRRGAAHRRACRTCASPGRLGASRELHDVGPRRAHAGLGSAVTDSVLADTLALQSLVAAYARARTAGTGRVAALFQPEGVLRMVAAAATRGRRPRAGAIVTSRRPSVACASSP